MAFSQTRSNNLHNTTEARQNFKQYNSYGTDASDMINKLKSSNVALGFEKTQNGPRGQVARDKINQEIGSTNKMYSYVQRRGFQSNVLPSNANADTMKPLNAHVNPQNNSIN